RLQRVPPATRGRSPVTQIAVRHRGDVVGELEAERMARCPKHQLLNALDGEDAVEVLTIEATVPVNLTAVLNQRVGPFEQVGLKARVVVIDTVTHLVLFDQEQGKPLENEAEGQQVRVVR